MPRKKAASGEALDSKAEATPRKTAEDAVTPEEFIPLAEAIGRLIGEVAQGRIRHRALLQTLLEANVIDWDRYVENLVSIADKDFPGIVSQLLLTREAFNKRYGEWHKQDMEKYGFAWQAVREKMRPPAKSARGSPKRRQ
jgi:hypothetical protein